ncbi:MAG: MFS transporter [Acidimicrobiales bacterium]
MTEPTKRADRGAPLVLVVATVTAMLTGPGQTIGVSVFIDHFVEDLALSRSHVSTAYLIGTLVGATALPTVGRWVDRFGVRRAQLAIAPLFALALFQMSFVNGMLWLAVGFTGIRFLGQGSLSLVATVTVSLGFVRNRGIAIGLFSTGSSALMAIVPVLLAVAIDQVGWRRAWWVAALTVATLLVPMAWFGLRSSRPGRPAGGVASASTPQRTPRPRWGQRPSPRFRMGPTTGVRRFALDRSGCWR